MRILIVEDDELVADALKRGLGEAGFVVDRVGSAEQAEPALSTGEFDLAVVDIGLPQIDGLTLVRRLRRAGNTTPILILTARDGLADRVDALDLGADDYLVKPFELPEVAARCRALIRRTRSATSAELHVGPLSLDLASRTALLSGSPLEVTPREWALLECLALDAGRVVRKERLLRAIGGWDDELTPNAIEVYVSRLRGKLGDAVAIRTVRGLGYRLDEPGV
ncbi:MAG: response regulator [Pseudomonadota bacterium]